MDLLLLHLVIIVWLSVGSASRWTDHPSDWLLAAGALVWANLLVTSLLLSLFGRLGEPAGFVSVSVALAVMAFMSAWRFPARLSENSDPLIVHGGLAFAVFVTLAPVILAMVWIAASYLPTDPASLSLSLPRAMGQISAGSILTHPSGAAWQSIHPCNHGLLQVWALVLQPSLQALNYFNVIGWLAAGLAVQRFARVAGGRANSALVAGWCALMATPVLAQALTVGPVLFTGAALVAAASFTLDWKQRGRPASAAFAGLLAGLAAGSSLGALLLVAVAVPVGSVSGLVPRRGAGGKTFWPCLGLGLLPYLLVSTTLIAEQDFGAWRMAWSQLADGASGLGVATLIPLWQTPDLLRAPTEDTVGLGWTGLVCLAAVALNLGRLRKDGHPVAWLSWLALAWLGVAVLASHWIGHGVGALVPGILLAAPGVAPLLDRITLPSRALILLGAGLAVGSLWSAQLYLWHNAYRPLAPLLDPTLAVRQYQPPPTLEQRLHEEPSLRPAPSISATIHAPATVIELVSTGGHSGVDCTGLLPAEGPFPQWNLPLIRWMREETVTLRIKAAPSVAQLRLSFSIRLYVRRRGVLEISCNGTPVRKLEFDDPAAWQEQLIELPIHPGENLIELRDMPLPPEPDWAAYLERYSDVKRHVEMMRQPPSEGAREHYEQSGKAEGRIITLIQPPRPAPGTYLYMFRRLQVEEVRP